VAFWVTENKTGVKEEVEGDITHKGTQ